MKTLATAGSLLVAGAVLGLGIPIYLLYRSFNREAADWGW